MSQITGFVDENRIVGKEIDGDVFEVVAGQLRPKFDPASTSAVTMSAAGIKVDAPATAPTTHTITDTANTTFTSKVNGVTAIFGIDLVSNTNHGFVPLLPPPFPEGVTLLGGGSQAEWVSNTTGYDIEPGVFGEQLDLSFGPFRLPSPIPLKSLITCGSLNSLFTASTPTPAMNLLADSCTKLKIKQAVSALGTPLNYWVIAA